MPHHLTTVCVESPLAGDLERNIAYARACMCYCLGLNAAPYVSHLLYTQVLDDDDPRDRELGIAAGLALGDACSNRWFFVDFGMSPGMKRALERAETINQGHFSVLLGDNWRTVYSSTPTRGFA